MGDVGRGHDEETKNGRTSRLLAETASAKAAASSEAPAAEAWNCIVFLTRGGSGRRECKFVDKARRKDREGQVREGRRTRYTASVGITHLRTSGRDPRIRRRRRVLRLRDLDGSKSGGVEEH